MKKWFLWLFLIIIFFISSIFLFLPQKLTVSKVTVVHCLSEPAGRFLINGNEWQTWLHNSHTRILHGSAYEINYKSYKYTLSDKFFSSTPVTINHGGISFKSSLTIIPIPGDSSIIHWETSFLSLYNPINRILQYFRGKELQSQMAEILDQFKTFAEKSENIYGFNITRTGFTDTLLLATKIPFSYKPDTRDFYSVIKRTKDYINSKGSSTINSPMINLQTDDSLHYRLMVALPIDKLLPEIKPFYIVRMQRGNFVEATVNGGPYTIKKGHQQIQNYMSDHGLTSPAVPFEILVTDRSKQSDSTKWVTKICYPST